MTTSALKKLNINKKNELKGVDECQTLIQMSETTEVVLMSETTEVVRMSETTEVVQIRLFVTSRHKRVNKAEPRKFLLAKITRNKAKLRCG